MKKKIFNKKNILIMGILLLLILIVVIIILKRKDDKFALNSIYDVYPEEVRNLYQNTVDVSCYGAMHFDLELDSEAILIDQLDDNILLDYMFSYLDKNDLLTNDMKVKNLRKIYKKLFYSKKDISDMIDDYTYSDYKYNISELNKISRSSYECSSSLEYVSQLFGYSYNESILSIDVNIGYLDKGILYDLNDVKLGEYNGKEEELNDLFVANSYYRYNYILNNNGYKLYSIEYNRKY